MKAKIVVSGGGKYIPELLMKEGSSHYLDSILLPYSKEATLETLGLENTNHKFVSKEFVLEGLNSLKEKTKRPQWDCSLIVVFASCSLFYKGQREGRKNRFFGGCFTMHPDGRISESSVVEVSLENILDRTEQEKFVSKYITSTILDMGM